MGYYHLGMNFDEYWSQTQKKKEATEVTDSITLQSKYILSINGIGFDVDNIISPAADITASDNETTQRVRYHFSSQGITISLKTNWFL